MPASSKRAKRVEKRNQYRKQTGQIKKAHKGAKRQAKFDTQNEPDNVVRDLGNRKKFHWRDLANVQLLNERQEQFADHFDKGTPIIFSLGFPGTAKTFLSLYYALAEVFDESTPYEQVVIIRSAVESRGIGYLKGDTDEKLAVYEQPYRDTIQELMPKFNDPYQHCKALGYVKFESTSFLRGRSIPNTIFIIEEAQNMDYKELYTAVTRISENSRVLVTGDVNQDDLERKREKSGLAKLIKVIEQHCGEDTPYVGYVNYQMDDIVRSGICRMMAIADYEYHN